MDWIGAPLVWDQGYRGDCILVAVLDTGIDLQHTDLVNRLWTGADGSHGYDFVNGDTDPMDDNRHGTHVAGTIAGDGTGGTITGVAPQARLMAVKVLDAFGSGAWGGILAGIGYALANNAQVLNLSLGGRCQASADRSALRAAADVAELAGVTMCVASGNDRCNERPPNVVGTPGDVPPPWISPSQPPIGITSGVTTVGATDRSDMIAGFSNPGPVDWSQVAAFIDWMLCDPVTPNVGLIKPDLSAPGVGINSTMLGGGYSGDTWNGTSMATPHVAGLAALILSYNSNLISWQIHSILETSAIDLGPLGTDNDYGAGRISAPDALAITPPPPNGAPLVFLSRRIDDTAGGNGDGQLDAGETAELFVTLYNQGAYVIGNVLGILSTTDPYVQVADSLATFGDIPPGESRENVADPFRVIVDPGGPEGHVVQFTLFVSGDGACTLFAFDETLGGGGLPPTGACCPAEGAGCEILSGPACADQCGDFQGIGTLCDPLPCEEGFQVVISDPPPGEIGAPWRPTVTVTFNEPVMEEDLTPETFRVRGAISGPAPGTIRVAEDGLSATFTPYYGPSRTFHAGEQVEVTVAGSVRSAEGDPLLDPWVSRFRTFAQRGGGTFEEPITIPPDVYLEDLAAGDLNQDGKTDLVGCGDTLVVYLNTTPDGGSLTYEAVSTPIGWVRPRTAVLQDLDNDGDLDIVVGEAQLGEIRVGLNDGDGSSYAWTTWVTGLYPGPWELKGGDLDGDGSVDVAFCDQASFNVYLGDGAGGVKGSGI